MSGTEKIEQALKEKADELAAKARENFGEMAEQAEAEMRAFHDESKRDLVQFGMDLADKRITMDEFKILMQGKQERLVIKYEKFKGMARVEVGEFAKQAVGDLTLTLGKAALEKI